MGRYLKQILDEWWFFQKIKKREVTSDNLTSFRIQTPKWRLPRTFTPFEHQGKSGKSTCNFRKYPISLANIGFRSKRLITEKFTVESQFQFQPPISTSYKKAKANNSNNDSLWFALASPERYTEDFRISKNQWTSIIGWSSFWGVAA